LHDLSEQGLCFNVIRLFTQQPLNTVKGVLNFS
jgi:hypothetical protein